MARSSTSSSSVLRSRATTQQDGTKTGLVATAGAAGVGALSGAGGMTVSSCPPEEKGFYCSFVRGFNILKMILVILAVLVALYFLYVWWRGSNGSKGVSRKVK